MRARLILICLWYSCVLLGQDTLFNEAKYWVWRDRLVNDFMVPNYTGDMAHDGRGIVFNERGLYNWYVYLFGGFDISDEGFELGKYLIVLATEWRLLYNSGLPTKQTEAEIYWALKTIDRLDFNAEHHWWYFWSKGQNDWGGLIDGFMIRDDVFTNFLWYNPTYPTPENNIDTAYFNFFKKHYSLESISHIPKYLKFNADAYENYKYLNQGRGGNKGKYIDLNIMLTDTQNNIYDLVKLMELKRISRNSDNYPVDAGFSGAMAGLYSCFDDKKDDYDTAYYKYYNLSFNFNRSEFREDHWTGPEEYSQDNYIGLLLGLVAVRKFVNSDVVVNEMRLSSYAAQIIERIIYSIKKNDSYREKWVIDNRVTDECVKGVFWSQYIDNCYIPWVCVKHYCNAGGAQAGLYSGQFARIYEKYVGREFNGQAINGVGGGDNAKMSAILITLTGYVPLNARDESEVERLKEINKRCCKLIDNKLRGTRDQVEYQYLDLLFCSLHGLSEPHRGFQHYENILDTTRCPVIFSNRSERNLLSAMIIHNLLKLLRGGKYNYQIKDNNIYPRTISFLGGGVYPICNETVVAIHRIESSAIISSYAPFPDYGYGGNPCKANVTYKAGREIHLKPGFKVINGAKFHAYIEPVDYCQVKEGNPDVAVLSTVGRTCIDLCNEDELCKIRGS